MLNSLEIRSPFLDQHMIEFAYGKVPSYLKADLNEKKIFLKKVAPHLLPTEFKLNRKQGFSIPLDKWLKKGPYRDLFWDTLTSSDCMFDAKTVKRLYRNQNLGFRNGERMFSLVLFELWRKAYGISH
jgi:asparagine synthase (glutamine-hydrolysing)